VFKGTYHTDIGSDTFPDIFLLHTYHHHKVEIMGWWKVIGPGHMLLTRILNPSACPNKFNCIVPTNRAKVSGIYGDTLEFVRLSNVSGVEGWSGGTTSPYSIWFSTGKRDAKTIISVIEREKVVGLGFRSEAEEVISE